jgi:membrane protein required for colicin V production
MDLPFEFADVAVIAILLISGLLAYFRGLVREILSLATWIGAALGALYGLSYVQPFVRQVISINILADILAGASLFLVSLVILTLINHLVSSRVKDSALGAIDRGLGFLFGIARGALLVSVAFIAASWFWVEAELDPYIADSRTLPIVRQGADLLRRVIPRNMQMESRAQAGNALETAKQAVEAKQLFDKIGGGGAPKTADPPSYNRNERSDMQRLIDSKQ